MRLSAVALRQFRLDAADHRLKVIVADGVIGTAPPEPESLDHEISRITTRTCTGVVVINGEDGDTRCGHDSKIRP